MSATTASAEPDALDALEPSVPAPVCERLPERSARLIVGGSLPLLVVALLLTWQHPAYRFFPLAWLGGLWLMRRGWREMASDLVPGTRVGAALLLGLAWAMVAGSTLLWSAWGGATGALLAVAGLAWWAGGWPAVRVFLPGLLVIALAVPPPLGLDAALLDWLGAKSVSAASRLLHDRSVTHVVIGSNLEIPGVKLPLHSLSSLVNVLPAVAVCAVFYAAWLRRAWWRGVLMAPVAAACALALATLTVVYAVGASAAYKLDMVAGARGWFLLLAVMGIAAALVASLDQALEFLLSPVMEPLDGEPERVPQGGPGPQLTVKTAPAGPARWGAWAFLVLGLVQAPLALLFLRHEFGPTARFASRLPATARFELAVTNQWTAVPVAPIYLPFPETNASTRAVWYFDSGKVAVALVADHPVAAGDDPLAAYERAGWRLAGQRQHPGAGAQPAPWAYGLMQKERGEVAAFCVGRMDESGRWLGPSEQGLSLLTPFRARRHGPAVLRIFALAVGKQELTDPDREQLEEFFHWARATLGRQFVSQLTPP
jgi:hypothetical protein